MYHTKYKQTVKVFAAPVGLAQARPNYKTQKVQVALLPVVLDCLKHKERERPSYHELCGCISTLKASSPYTKQSQAKKKTEVNKPTERGGTTITVGLH